MEKRTSIDLSPNDKLCFNKGFELSFDLAFTPNQKDYFGYIFRIIDEDDYNIDLLYDQKESTFKLITDNKFSGIEFNIPKDMLFEDWSNIRIIFDFLKDKITLYASGKHQTIENIGFKSTGCFKILFGANNYKKFQTMDIPSMNIKDIKVVENSKVKYWWPLDEDNGEKAIDKIQKKVASVNNPNWIKALHTKWILNKKLDVNGNVNVAFNQKEETLYIINSESLITYSIHNQKFDVIPNPEKRLQWKGSQSVFDNASGKLYDFYIDQKKVSTYNFENKTWDSNFIKMDTLTEYWHANKFISNEDTSIYILGGYGQLEYKNTMFRYHIPTATWKNWETEGDQFNPRYLAALGTTINGDTAYVLGGYGSTTGKQALGSKHYYDFVRYTVKDRTFKTIFTIKNGEDNFAFANSLIIDSNSFYGLIFPNNKFNSYLQLVKGSIDSSNYQLIGDRIPYFFHDVNSFADIFYDQKSKKLIAVTLFQRADNTTEIKIYSLSFPPAALELNLSTKNNLSLKMIYIVISILIILMAVYILRKKLKKNLILSDAGFIPFLEPESPEVHTLNKNLLSNSAVKFDRHTNSIFTFGNFQVFDKEGIDITKLFTPLIKELFLIVLFHSLRKESGISSKKLDEILWFDKSPKDARNNRSVNITKLRTILEKMDGCELTQESGYWKIILNPGQSFNDYALFLSIINTEKVLEKQSIEELIKVIKRGSLLANSDFEWLDDFKSEVSNEVVSAFIKYTTTIAISSDPHFLIEIANSIFTLDSVNEEAIALKCKGLIHLGKHSLAKDSFDKFVKNYQSLYDDSYEQTYNEILD